MFRHRQIIHAATQAIKQLEAISTADPEQAHGEADEILLVFCDAVEPKVSKAYVELIARCKWWTTA